MFWYSAWLQQWILKWQGPLAFSEARLGVHPDFGQLLDVPVKGTICSLYRRSVPESSKKVRHVMYCFQKASVQCMMCIWVTDRELLSGFYLWPLMVPVSCHAVKEMWGDVPNFSACLFLNHDKQLLLSFSSAAYANSSEGSCQRAVKAQKHDQHVWLKVKWHSDDLKSSLFCACSPETTLRRLYKLILGCILKHTFDQPQGYLFSKCIYSRLLYCQHCTLYINFRFGA